MWTWFWTCNSLITVHALVQRLQKVHWCGYRVTADVKVTRLPPWCCKERRTALIRWIRAILWRKCLEDLWFWIQVNLEQSDQITLKVLTQKLEKLHWCEYQVTAIMEVRRVPLQRKAGSLLCISLRATLASVYVPMKWKEEKVAFIPIPSKDAYDRSKSFKAIPLTWEGATIHTHL